MMNMHAPMTAPGQMSRRRKAAMIVQMIIDDGTQVSLSRLPAPVREALAGGWAAGGRERSGLA